MVGCTLNEIAHITGVSPDTLARRFADAIKKGRAQVAMSLRRKQIELALKGNGNATMLIWLGKQLLGQRDDGLPIGASDNPEAEALSVAEQAAAMSLSIVSNRVSGNGAAS